MADGGLAFEVGRSDWKQTRFVEGPVPDLAPGQVLFRVHRFALTANNISYALSGDMLGYWRFFPCETGWGRIPVMGFADVIRSTHSEVAEGTRCFGFYPMARHLVIQPGVVSPSQIVDAAPHRAGLAPVHRHLGDALQYDCAIGATHWAAARNSAELPGPKPEFFFAPAQIVKRSKDWGPQGLSERLAGAWTKFCDASDAWLHVVRSSGRAALERVYQDTLAGRTHPADGHIVSL